MQYKYYQTDPPYKKKKFYSRLLTTGNGFGIILIILVIPLYIVYFGEYINEKTVDILIAVAAVVSTCFLYLAFRESKKSNELKIYEYLFLELEKQVKEIEIKAEKNVFDDDVEIIINEFNFPKDKLMKVKYSNFIYGIKKLFSHIEQDTKYQKCIALLGKENKIIINDETLNEIRSSAFALLKIRTNTMHIFSYYFEIMKVYDSIDKFPIHKELKKYLIARLNAITNEYFLLIEPSPDFDEVRKYLRQFVLVEIKNNELIKKDSGFIIHFKSLYNAINKIKEDYKDERIFFDPFKQYKKMS